LWVRNPIGSVNNPRVEGQYRQEVAMGKKKGDGGASVFEMLQSVYAPKANVSRRSVIINGVPLSDALINSAERTWGALADGAYWYDPICGAWGMQGGPCVGYCTPGLQLGGPLRANASNGQTGLLINGRELPLVELPFWQGLGLSAPGHYWLDATGNYGVQGGVAWGNLAAASQSSSGQPRSYQSRFNQFGTMGGDGAGHFFYFDKKNSWSN
jgi:hypothetical protein